ncbi:MAG: hypothetical protein ACI9LM_003191 [Alteromonadaceae bacterium]|jgi:hypothetical protein
MKLCDGEGSMKNLTADTNLVNDIRDLLEQSCQRLQQTVFFITKWQQWYKPIGK